MNLFALFKKRGSAPIARDRLQILLAHERTIAGGSDLVAILREEILAVVKKHVHVDAEKVQVKMERGKAVSTLAVDIEIPTPTAPLSKIERPKPKVASAAAAS
jgi:cell division topological specificity factor